MQVITVTEASKSLGISARMLRYYEKLGLISAVRREDYAYRCYDEFAVRRLQQIVVLRKLRIPLKQIAAILTDGERQNAYRCFVERMQEVDGEIASLKTIRNFLQEFVYRLSCGGNCDRLLDDKTLTEIAALLVLPKTTLKETKMNMKELDEATKSFNGDLRIRIVVLPPMTVASYHYIGDNPEEVVGNTVSRFVQQSKLYEKKPDARLFGFNHPNPSPDRPYGYEDWLTVPDEMEVPAPFVKKRVRGGTYAALTIDFPNFHEWELLIDWVAKSDKWEADYAAEGEEIMGGCLEEHLNWVLACHLNWPENGPDGKLDLLLPVKARGGKES